MSLIDCKFQLEKLFAKSPQNGWPHGNFTIFTHSSNQDDIVKAAKSDLEFLDPCGEMLCQSLSLNFNSHKSFQICWIASNLDEWRNIDDDSSNITANQVDCCCGIPKFTH
jgi:hypothetical protein